MALTSSEGITNPEDDGGEIIQAGYEELGHWSYDEEEKITTAVLNNGQVWLRSGSLNETINKKTMRLLKKVCPNGEGALPRKGHVYNKHARMRFANPNDDCNGNAPPYLTPR